VLPVDERFRFITSSLKPTEEAETTTTASRSAWTVTHALSAKAGWAGIHTGRIAAPWNLLRFLMSRAAFLQTDPLPIVSQLQRDNDGIRGSSVMNQFGYDPSKPFHFDDPLDNVATDVTVCDREKTKLSIARLWPSQ
jgi:hypothetical protein